MVVDPTTSRTTKPTTAEERAQRGKTCAEVLARPESAGIDLWECNFIVRLLADLEALTAREQAMVAALRECHDTFWGDEGHSCEDDGGPYLDKCKILAALSNEVPPLSGTEEARRQSRPDDVT